MARIKLAYVGGGSSRAAGTMASFLHHGSEFDGSEVVLVDLNADHLEIVRTIADKMARNAGLDIKIPATAGLDPERAEIYMAGVNHNIWSTTHTYDGEDIMPLLDEAWERVKDDPSVDKWDKRMLSLAVAMRSIPSGYFRYYYFGEEY